ILPGTSRFLPKISLFLPEHSRFILRDLEHDPCMKPTRLCVAADDPYRLVRQNYAAEFLGVTLSQMKRWRRQREGPRWRRQNRMVVYQLADLLSWIDSLPAAGGRVA